MLYIHVIGKPQQVKRFHSNWEPFNITARDGYIEKLQFAFNTLGTHGIGI